MLSARLRPFTLLSLLGVVSLASACNDRVIDPGDPDSDPDEQLDPRVLRGFNSCEDMLAYTHDHALDLLERDMLWGWGYVDPWIGLDDVAEEDAAGNDTGSLTTGGGDEGGGDGGGFDESTDDSSSPDHSTTNVQEVGVDEPDLVKTDGEKILALANGRLNYVDVSGVTPELRGSLELPDGYNHEMFLSGDRALVISRSWVEELPVTSERPAEWEDSYFDITQLTEIDISNPDEPEAVRVLHVAGGYVSARMIDSTVRMVVRSTPVGLPLKDWWEFYDPGYDDEGDIESASASTSGSDHDEGEEPVEATSAGEVDTGEVDPGTTTTGANETEGEPGSDFQFRQIETSPDEEQAQALARAYNKEVLENSRAENWLPQYLLEDFESGENSSGLLYDCESSLRPGLESGLGLLSVVNVDLSQKLAPQGGVGVYSVGETVYASTESLYVATHPWWSSFEGGAELDGVTEDKESEWSETSYVHRFDIRNEEQNQYVASGRVPGHLYSQWAMSEYDGDLRVATTTWGWDTGQSESHVSVLRADGDLLNTVGHVDGLGLDEDIYAVRFMGEIGYIVTFRQIDPLYTVDLGDPANPRVRGELKITGYSAYLHPMDKDHLIGVGQEATTEGQALGAQVSLFDVSNLDDPSLKYKFELGESWTEAEHDHHAFLYWARDNLLALPALRWDWTWDEETQTETSTYAASTQLLQVTADNGFERIGEIEHPELSLDEAEYYYEGGQRSIVVDDHIYTTSAYGVMATDLDDLADGDWIEFPRG